MTFINVLLVGVGGFFGAIARFFVSRLINKSFTHKIPTATLTVNLLGSFLLGLIIGSGINNSLTLLLGTGFMGAFTTFSTFKLEGVQLLLEKKKKELVTYYLLSYGGGILLAFLGLMLGSH